MASSKLPARMVAVLLLMQFVFSVYFIWYVVNSDTKPAPPLTVLRLINPQPVHNKRVRQNEAVKVTGVKCNLTNEPISVDGVSYLIQESPVYRRYLRQQSTGVARVPGCSTFQYANDLRVGLPQDVTLEPGTYHLEGTETVRQGDRVQNAPWYTESFEIIE